MYKQMIHMEKKSQKSKKAQAEVRPEYEKLYDSLFDGVLSADTAARIERDSWEITNRLVELFDSADGRADEIRDTHGSSDFMTESSKTLGSSENSEKNDTLYILESGDDCAVKAGTDSFDNITLADHDIMNGQIQKERLKKAVMALLQNDRSSFYDIASSMNLMPDSLVENINVMSYTLIGDVAVEPDSNGFFAIIDDYRKELEEFADE